MELALESSRMIHLSRMILYLFIIRIVRVLKEKSVTAHEAHVKLWDCLYLLCKITLLDVLNNIPNLEIKL